MKQLKTLCKYIILALIGGLIYITIEFAFRGHSHWSMFLCGAVCAIVTGGLNEWIPWEMSLWKQALLGGLYVTIIELIFGLIFNVWLGYGIWDYSNLPLSFFCNQVNLFFSLAWCGLSLVWIVLDDWLRYWLFKEERPHYKLK